MTWRHYLYDRICQIFYKSQNFKVSSHLKGVELKVEKELNYKCAIKYHPSKAIMVVDVLSCKSFGNLAHLI